MAQDTFQRKRRFRARALLSKEEKFFHTPYFLGKEWKKTKAIQRKARAK